jgi:hypothetical protein
MGYGEINWFDPGNAPWNGVSIGFQVGGIMCGLKLHVLKFASLAETTE